MGSHAKVLSPALVRSVKATEVLPLCAEPGFCDSAGNAYKIRGFGRTPRFGESALRKTGGAGSERNRRLEAVRRVEFRPLATFRTGFCASDVKGMKWGRMARVLRQACEFF